MENTTLVHLCKKQKTSNFKKPWDVLFQLQLSRTITNGIVFKVIRSNADLVPVLVKNKYGFEVSSITFTKKEVEMALGVIEHGGILSCEAGSRKMQVLRDNDIVSITLVKDEVCRILTMDMKDWLCTQRCLKRIKFIHSIENIRKEYFKKFVFAKFSPDD